MGREALTWAVLGALALSRCHLCEYRDYASSYVVDVDLDDPCPPPPSGEHDPPGNEGLVSVNGAGVRKVSKPATQSCCYHGDFLVEGAAFTGDLCTVVELPGRGDEATDFCPDRESIRSTATSWTFRHRDGTQSVDPMDVTSLDSGPTPGQISLRQDRCVYPATSRTEADACG